MRIWLSAAILGVILLTPMATVQAQTNINIQNSIDDVPLENNYDFRNDPFLLEGTFAVKQQDAVTTEEQSTNPDEKILARWKEKQLDKWATLPREKFLINASAYTAAADECGKSNGITSSGLKVEEKRTLACPPSLPFGAKIYIEGVGERRCEDRGGAIKGNHIDIYMPTKTEAFAFGRQTLEAYVIE